ncbi:MAG: winged helix-turn-helix transcriptional regulator [Holophagales bacterium]|nr:winged helix-turn-helix transcriptional regulator [Holophagales bacterium]
MDSPLNRTLGATKALANPARLRILAALEKGECCVCQLTAVLELAPSTVSAHLSELRRAGFLLDRKDGKIVFYRLSDRPELKPWLKATNTGIQDDERIAADRAFLDRVKAVDVETFCAAGPRWKLLPAFRPAPKRPSVTRKPG